MGAQQRTGSLTRRDALTGALAAAAAATTLGRLGRSALGAPKPAPLAIKPRATAVIEVWMSGGPCHLDTWDPKVEAGTAYSGAYTKTVDTKVAGLRLAQPMTELGKIPGRFSLIRSLTHGVNAHETAAYIVQTGRTPTENGLSHPSFATIVSYFKGPEHGYRGLIPPHVMLTTPRGRFSEIGYMGLQNSPFVTGGNPREPRFAVEGVVAEGLTDARQAARRVLLDGLDTLGRAIGETPDFQRFDQATDEAYGMILGDAGKVFDLRQEKNEVRDRYGRTTFGQSCLAARRLIERGVPYVTIHVPGWDTHQRHFERMNQMLPDLDRGLATLLTELDERGLLASTLVWCAGEFGRTPRVQWEEPWNGGRSHHGACFSALVAGGGFQGGRVLGATDAHGEEVDERPVHPRELLATMYALLGIDPEGPLPNPRGLDVQVLPAEAGDKGPGRLKELL